MKASIVTLGVLTVSGILAAGAARAANIGVVPTKLIVIDKLNAASKAKAVYVAKDGGATKGSGTDATAISVTFTVAYDGETGEWTTGGADFLVNKTSVAKFVNKDAPGGPTVIKVAAIKPAKLLKMVAKERGDGDVLDILAQGAPGGSVFSAYQVVNGAETNTHCSESNSCSYKLIAGGTGRKLVCKGGVADPGCTAAGPACLSTSGCLCDTGLTVIDSCNGLEWEKKATAVGSGVDAGNLNDVDNNYLWAGACTISGAACQPNAAASTTCAGQTGGALGCDECGGGEGTCDVDPFGFGAITTIWDWVNTVNAAAYAGQSDWRLPTMAGSGEFPTGEAAELELIVLTPAPGCSPCIDSIFGSTLANGYLSASTQVESPELVWGINFHGGFDLVTDKIGLGEYYVRAVRAAP